MSFLTDSGMIPATSYYSNGSQPSLHHHVMLLSGAPSMQLWALLLHQRNLVPKTCGAQKKTLLGMKCSCFPVVASQHEPAFKMGN